MWKVAQLKQTYNLVFLEHKSWLIFNIHQKNKKEQWKLQKSNFLFTSHKQGMSILKFSVLVTLKISHCNVLSLGELLMLNPCSFTYHNCHTVLLPWVTCLWSVIFLLVSCILAVKIFQCFVIHDDCGVILLLYIFTKCKMSKYMYAFIYLYFRMFKTVVPRMGCTTHLGAVGKPTV